MPETLPNLSLEIPSSVEQQEIQDLNEHLKQIDGVSTDLQEPKSIFAAVLLVLNIAATVMGPVGAIAGGAAAIHEVAKRIHDFIHTKNERYDVVLQKKGRRVELKNLTIEQIEHLLKEP